ncbi:MAG: M16 family metallopeptidase [Bryobacteraceae bacterium]
MRFVVTFAAAACLLAPLAAQEVNVDIPYQKFVLGNGLTLLVHEDRKAPIVAVNIWYHVGSKNEKRGRTGFAHLFEHLMFNGTEHFNQDYFKVLEKIGATDLNGTTNSDRTNYFQNVPASALDTVLWMESDRMGHLLGAIDQARLDEQRGVVQNEKRQGENRPYGRTFEVITEATYPPNHPYSWSTIGYMEDLSAATLADVHEWFKTYYGPSNATLVIAGDIDPKTAREKVEKFFGHIPPGPPVAQQRSWVAKRTGTHRQVMQDRVPQARIYKIWNTPQIFSGESECLSLASAILGRGRTSRLYRRLVYDEQLATDVTAMQMAREMAGQFMVIATARPGVELARMEKALDEEVARFLSGGPTREELERVKTVVTAAFVRGLERIGGFGGKSDVLATGQVYAGDPGAYKRMLAQYQSATAEDVKRVANAWLSDGVFVLEVQPFGNYKPANVSVDRSKVPEPGAPPAARLPKIQRAQLSSGLKIVLAERPGIPVVEFDLLVNAGAAAESAPGVAEMAADMLTSGTKTRNAIRIAEESESLAANLRASSTRDTTSVSLSAMKNKLDASLELWADVILNPAFDAQEFRRIQKQAIAAIMRSKASPDAAAARVFPAAVWGREHPYGKIVTEKDLAALNPAALARFHQQWFQPNNAVLVIAGDTTLAEIRPKLEKIFAAWKPGRAAPPKVTGAPLAEKPLVYLIDRPGAPQSVVVAGHIAPPRNNPDEIAIEALNAILGGAFVSRVNMNLREDKHWTYGARTSLSGGIVQRALTARAPVQSDKTRETMMELKKEFSGIVSSNRVTAEELDRVREQRSLRLSGQFESTSAVVDSIAEMVRNGLPDDFYDTYAANMRKLTLNDVNTAAEKLIKPDRMIWVVVGDRSRIEAGIRELNYGELRIVDADGNPAP